MRCFFNGDDHRSWISSKVHNHPKSRAHASEIVEQLARMVLQLSVKSHTALITTQTENNSKSLTETRETNWKLRSENTPLQCTVSELQADVEEKLNIIEMNASSIKRKDSELQAKSGALEEKDTTISAMSEQLTNVREYLATEKQVSTK